MCTNCRGTISLLLAHPYYVFSDNSIIEVERTATGASYDEFVQSLPLDDCRYAVFDFQFEKAGEGQRSKICFYVWAPDTAKIKQKMLYAASKDAIRKKLVGIASEIQCTDLSEVSYDAVLERVAGPGR